MRNWNAYLRLVRPANIITAFADILAGFGIAAVPTIAIYPNLIWHFISLLLLLLITTASLYGGGIVFNDVCDADLDRYERPERPIPMGIISKKNAILLSIVLWLLGIIAAFFVSMTTGFLAIAVMILSIIYDAYLKHYSWLAAFNIALCRAINLLVGISVVTIKLIMYWPLMWIPFAFVCGVSFISQEEVHALNKKKLVIALLFYIITILILLFLLTLPGFRVLSALPFLIIFSLTILLSIARAIKFHDAHHIQNAVKIGIIALILLDATLAAGFASWWYGIIIVLLIPITILAAKKFAIT